MWYSHDLIQNGWIVELTLAWNKEYTLHRLLIIPALLPMTIAEDFDNPNFPKQHGGCGKSSNGI